MSFRLSGSNLAVSFAAIASGESSCSSGSSGDGESWCNEDELAVVFWWLWCRSWCQCAVVATTVVNAVHRSGAVLGGMMCVFDTAVERAVQTGYGVVSCKLRSVYTFVGSDLCGLCGSRQSPDLK